jgi:hypothetical protein
MKHLKVFAVLLFTMVAAPMFADQAQSPRNLVDDVIKMAKAGVADDAIMTFVQKSDGRFEVTADDVIAMSDSNVSKTVIKAVVEESHARNSWRERPAEANDKDGERTRVRERTVYVTTPSYYYNPWYSSWYDPFWYGYGPRVSLGFGFGGYGRGYHSYGGGHGHGGGHGGHGRGRH